MTHGGEAEGVSFLPKPFSCHAQSSPLPQCGPMTVLLLAVPPPDPAREHAPGENWPVLPASSRQVWDLLLVSAGIDFRGSNFVLLKFGVS